MGQPLRADARSSAKHGGAPDADTVKCRVCTCGLGAEEGDDFELKICASCKDRPEARRLGMGIAPLAPRRPHTIATATPNAAARDFTPAERSMIAKMHSFIPGQQLLDLLNERLVCDLGPDATPYRLEDLQKEIAKYAPAAPNRGHDWASLRKILGQARRAGVLAQINEQVINDFAIVFSLNPKQVMALKDILLQPEASQ